METTVSFGYWIRRQRKALDVTQQVLADRVGCSLAEIKKIEGDERKPSRQIAERLADALGVPAGQRERFLEVARGLRTVDQLSLAREPVIPSRPSGTVTFLYTDIEGSTKLAQEHAEEWEALRARHHAILSEAIESNNGYVFQVVGDGFCAAFHTAGDAVRAAGKSQVDLQAENWGETIIRVRMGIHTGKAEVQQDGLYHGYVTLSHVQRLMSAGHGGQVLLSFATQELVQDELPEGVALRDMGEHRLKDFDRRERLFQLNIADLPSDFPPLNTLDSHRHNLPVQLTSFIGREKEIADVIHLLNKARMVTLTGPGGTGKTRLSIQVANDILDQYPDGVWLVELAPISDPSLVASTTAAALNLPAEVYRPAVDMLCDYLHKKQLLIVLDNCEHLVGACARMVDRLLHAAPKLRIIVSSREALGISGETVYRVPSLSLPSPAQVTREAIVDYESIQLFVERAIAVQSHFALIDSNASAVTQICHRLDGIPLALELAAARIAVFSPEEIASRLDDRFRLLTGGSRTALERHQTLRALIDWSYDLLSDEERMLFRQLSVFAGGWTFEAAEAICPDLDVLVLLTQLINKSLVMVDADKHAEGTRYRLPETIRQYARDKLLESGQAEQARDRHLDFFLGFAERAEPKLRSAEQIEWLERMGIEHDNLRTALAWSLESGKRERVLQLAGAVSYFWELRGYWSEGHKWLDNALALSERQQSERIAGGEVYSFSGADANAARRAKALYGAARMRYGALFDFVRSRTIVEESLRLWRELGDKWWIAVTLEHVGFLSGFEGDVQRGLACLEEGVSLAREVEDPWPLAVCLVRLGNFLPLTEHATARRIREEGVSLARNMGDKSVLSQGLFGLATDNLLEGNLTAAAPPAEEALAAARAIGSVTHVFLSLLVLVIISCLQGDPAKANGYCLQALAFARETGSPQWLLLLLFGFGLVACFGGQLERGVRLFAASETLLRRRGINISVEGIRILMVIKQALDAAVEKARAQLDPAAFAAAWAEGQQMTLEQALALATENEGEDSPLSKT